MRADVQKLHRISEEAKLLCRNDIKTTKELSLYKKTLQEEKQKYEEQRDKIYYKNTKLKKEERQENYTELSEIAGKIQFLKSQILMCDEIMLRVPKIKDNIEELEKKENEKEKGKERDQNEYRK